MHPHHAVVHLPPIAVPLPRDPHRVIATLGDPGLVHHADRLRVGMISGHDLLAAVVELLLIPLDVFEKTLYRSGSFAEPKRNAFGGFAMHIRQLPLDIDTQQLPRPAPAKTTGKQPQEHH